MTTDNWLPEEVRDVAERWGLSAGENPFEFVLSAIAEKVQGWLEGDRRALFQALYRLDVAEGPVRASLGRGDVREQSRRVAELILRRELLKARTRRQNT